MYPNHYSSQLLKALIISTLTFLFCAFAPVRLDAQRATYSANGSDYYVTCSWTGLTSLCCSETKFVKFYREGVRKKTIPSVFLDALMKPVYPRVTGYGPLILKHLII